MTRFNRDFRGQIANKVCRHYDKYCEIVNPVTFNVMQDVYRPAFKKKQWNALEELLDSKLGRKCLVRSATFELFTDDRKGRGSWERNHITFGFPDSKYRPDVEIEFQQLHVDAQEKINAWITKAIQLKTLRGKLFRRVSDLFNWEWDNYAGYNSQTGGRRGGPTPGVGCNTPGQLIRIWPELMAFMPVEHRDVVRQANMKSRLPSRIHDWGTIDQFLCLEPLHANQDPKELAFERRTFDALTHILVQMSLMIDVRHDDTYPVVHVAR
jgi:hypothetical protein